MDSDSLARLEERLDAERQRRALYESLAVLSSRDRALLELVAVDGLSIVEAAEVLGIKPGAARVRLHRGRLLVQDRIRLHAAAELAIKEA